MPMLMALLLLLSVPLGAAESLPPGFALCAGPMILCRAGELARADFSQADLDWLTRFRLVVTNGYEFPASRTLKACRARKCCLFRYFWANSFTAPEAASTALPDGDWRSRLVREHADWLLSPEPLPGPPGTPPSYFFDLARPELVEHLARLLAGLRAQGGYGGIFCDYAGANALPQAGKEVWQRGHPDVLYDRALAGFLKRRRRLDPECLILANGACLGDPALLPTVDYDMVESYGTSYAWGPVAKVGGDEVPFTFRRPCGGPGGIQAMVPPLLARLKTSRPRKALLCLDYKRPALRALAAGGSQTLPGSAGLEPAARREWEQVVDLDAVYYSYCAAAAWGLDSFCSGWYGVEYRGPLYFADLGKPLGDAPAEAGGLVLREYERGVMALTAGTEPAEATWRLQTKRVSTLYDLRTGETVAVENGAVTLRLLPAVNPLTGVAEPIGRVFLKRRK